MVKAEAIESPQRVVLDIDSTEIPLYGQQEKSAYNGHFESTCYHPLLLFNREGDCLAANSDPAMYTAPTTGRGIVTRIRRHHNHGKDVVVWADADRVHESLQRSGNSHAGFAVFLSGRGTLTQGVVLCNQPRVLELQARKARSSRRSQISSRMKFRRSFRR